MLSSLALDPSPDPSPASSPSPSPRPSEAASSAALPLGDKASALLPLQDKLGEDVHLQSEAEIMAAYGIGGARGQKNTPAIKLADPICIASDSECSPQKVAPNSFFREAGQSQKIKFEEMLSSFGGGGCTKYLLLRRWAPPFEEVLAWCICMGLTMHTRLN